MLHSTVLSWNPAESRHVLVSYDYCCHYSCVAPVFFLIHTPIWLPTARAMPGPMDSVDVRSRLCPGVFSPYPHFRRPDPPGSSSVTDKLLPCPIEPKHTQKSWVDWEMKHDETRSFKGISRLFDMMGFYNPGYVGVEYIWAILTVIQIINHFYQLDWHEEEH